MKISDISNNYKNKSLLIFFISLINLILFPLIFNFVLQKFSGFGFVIINSQLILNILIANKFLIIIALSIPILILLISIFVGLNRKLISNLFPILANITIYSLLIYYLFLSLVFCFILFCILNEFTNFRPTLILLFITISCVFLYFIPLSIQGIFKFTKEQDIYRIGVVLNKKDHPKIFGLIKNIARKINSREPKNLVIGLTTDIYVVGKGMMVLDGQKQNKIEGETLYLSIPFLRVFTVNELTGIIGHELAHFSGEDTSYALKFAPIYRRLNNQFITYEKELNESDNDFYKAISKISIFPLVFLFNELYRKDSKISIIREYRADKYGAEACGSNKDFISGLCKFFIYGTVWDWVEKDHYEMVRNNLKIDNISKTFAKEIKHKINHLTLSKYLRKFLRYQQKHPSDTHPAGIDRMKNLKVKLKEIDNKTLTNLKPSAASLFKDLTNIEERLTYIINTVIKYQ